MRQNTAFDPEIEHIGKLASRCFTELTPAWQMFYLFLRYLVLISLRSVCGTAVARRTRLLGFAVARRASLLGPSARRKDKLASLHASIAVLWAITTAPDVVHSSVDDLVGDVASVSPPHRIE